MLNRVRDAISAGIGGLFPGSFALVMATGIISIALRLQGMILLAGILFSLNKIFYLVLFIAIAARIIRFFPRFSSDVADPARGPGFLTIVAGTCTLGSQYCIIEAHFLQGRFLWYAGLVIWILLIYALLTAISTREDKPLPEKAIYGGWLLLVVSTQALSTLATLVNSGSSIPGEGLLLMALLFFLLGCMLYVLLIPIIFYRLIFLKITPAMLTPPYWIAMGAAAITTLAGSVLMKKGAHWTPVMELLPFLKGLSLIFWITATWWIPLLIILFVWRHAVRRYPAVYEPGYWSMVFTLGMYTTCSDMLGEAAELAAPLVISHFFIYVALCAWLLVLGGMILSPLKKRER